MEKIRWSDSYSVGVLEMDRQHQKLISMINRLIEEQKTLTDPETVAELLTEMTDYAAEHFNAEEYLMVEYGFPEKDKHAVMHQDFIRTTREFYSVNIGANILSKALLDYLKEWLVSHILDEDMEYSSFLEKKGVSGL